MPPLKFAYTTRHLPVDTIHGLAAGGDIVPRSGDVVVAEILSVGQHKRLESPEGRRRLLHVGDRIVVCFGNRYAPDQFEALVPARLEDCDLVAGGGLAARMVSKNTLMGSPTRIRPLGLALDAAGRRLNLADFALSAPTGAAPPPLVVAVIGTSMNAGKTTSAATLVRGLQSAGLRVGSAKVTGTGSGGDRWMLVDAGAEPALDFVDAGAASTAGMDSRRIEGIFTTLVAQLGAAGVEAAVIEVADGLLQAETAELVQSDAFRTTVDHVLFAAGDAMGATAGVRWLNDHDLAATALCGLVSAAPLGRREAVAAAGLPVLGLDQLAAASVAGVLATAPPADLLEPTPPIEVTAAPPARTLVPVPAASAA